ncbi:insulinase family protein [Actomonas aquatica]|uniref:Protease 3 n=1 Tax=Actomonas aquatica TaxID=2866162 RepID=A0ABZ1C4T9_9BACT|nr:insulinase family protein [Opitutus sp. WL0086]WRQ86258.1 insulinase family protein [Opitutus sp. WL0086]
MTRLLRLSLLAGTFLAALATATATHATARPTDLPPREVAPTDQATFGRLVLDNGLRVLLVSDPSFNKSAAALAVHVGQLEDPLEATGLAHFTEHMLFLGTEKFPDEGEYGTFVKNNGGYTNAYTSSDHTNYQFEVRHEALDDTLDRFAQFFIAPLFTPTFTEREVNAVHNEVMRHVQNDGRRIYNVMRELYAPDSPESRFTAGNKDTLAHADSATVRAFFNAYYSADRMALAITGAAPLTELEAMARRHFSAIPNRELGPLHHTATYQPRLAAFRLAQVEPVREVRALQLQFPLTATRTNFGAKNDALIARLFSHSSAGGLEHALKEAGLALNAGGGIWDRTADYSSLSLSVSLTPEGAADLPRVLDLIFGYIDFLQHSEFPTTLWEETARIAALNETYNDRGEGARLATALANQALFYPLAVAERVPHVWVAPDEADYRNILNQLTPDNLIAVFTAKGVPTDRTEEFYGTAYSYSEDTGPAYQRLLDARDPADGTFALPRANPYVPAAPSLLVERPTLLTREPGLTLFYAPDLEFQRPQTSLRFRFVPAGAAISPRETALLALFEASLGDALNATADEAARAGLSFNVGVSATGFDLTVTGFGDSALRFARETVDLLPHIAPTPERFAALKEGYLRTLRSFPQTEAFQLANARRSAWSNAYNFLPDQLLPTAEAATWDEVAAVAEAFFAAGTLEGIVHGHVAPETALTTSRELRDGLDFAAVSEDKLRRPRELLQEPGEVIADVDTTAGVNSVFSTQLFLPGADARQRAAATVLGNFIAQPFFNELRTSQQLGYIVGAGSSSSRQTRSLYFVIQSSTHDPDALRERAETFIATLPAQLAELSPEAFATLISGARSNLEAKDKSLAEKAGRFFSLAFTYDEDWERRAATLAALEELTQPELVSLLTNVLSGPGKRERLVLLSGENHTESAVPATFTDREAWKTTRQFQ